MSIAIHSVPLDRLGETLSAPEWAVGPLYFLGDIGGTNARLGFGRQSSTSAGGTSVQVVFVHFSMSRHNIGQLLEFFDAILGAIASTNCVQRIASGALSVPGPVSANGTVAGPFNNLEGLVELRAYPTTLFPPGRSALLNDLEAGGYGVLALSDARVFPQYFTRMWRGTGRAVAAGKADDAPSGASLGSGACLVVAPGTGLGMSLVVPVGDGGARAGKGQKQQRFHVLPMEFGSTMVPFQHGTEDYLVALSSFIHGDLARAAGPGSAPLVPIVEDSCCGASLIFNYLIEKQREKGAGPPAVPFPKSLQDARITPGQVAKLATITKEPAAVRALTTSYEALMRTCSEAVMTFLPETVVIIGDNVVRNGPLFEDPAIVERLQAVAYAHPMQLRGRFIERSTFLRQTSLINLNLLGCFGFGTRVSAAAAKL